MAGAAKVKKGAVSIGGPKDGKPDIVEVPICQIVELKIDQGITIKTVHGDLLIDCRSTILSVHAIDRTSESGGRIGFGRDEK